VIHSARMSLRRHPWSPTLRTYTKYDECDMVKCGDVMRAYMAAAATQSTEGSGPHAIQTAVVRKYASSKFGGVSRMPVTV
jgi:hypothetical protein